MIQDNRIKEMQKQFKREVEIVTEQQDKFLKSISKAVENGELKMSVAFRIIREMHK